MKHHRLVLLLLLVSFALACGKRAPKLQTLTPQDTFWLRLEQLCDQAYQGQVKKHAGENPFGDAVLVMHVRRCEDRKLQIALHVGDDRSRSLILARTEQGLEIKHENRRSDGSLVDTMPGNGQTLELGERRRQEFFVPLAEVEEKAANPDWILEITPGFRFTYIANRQGSAQGLHLDFDLNQAVEPPPAPWGF